MFYSSFKCNTFYIFMVNMTLVTWHLQFTQNCRYESDDSSSSLNFLFDHAGFVVRARYYKANCDQSIEWHCQLHALACYSANPSINEFMMLFVTQHNISSKMEKYPSSFDEKIFYFHWTLFMLEEQLHFTEFLGNSNFSSSCKLETPNKSNMWLN